jgi:hypothetical protein
VWVKPGVRFEDAPTGPAEWKMIDLDRPLRTSKAAPARVA